ncbi:DNA-3-methyladenine glycosylase family protein [Salimicrobium halophilum]|uniref:DNA-3-methyladenine glycosylase II n=1 Tax=Salimicrobium halophilum TaxID=86666 RepID=A0A1G8U6Q8_9BACI|nr:DNA-3-methyladenine glycosylase [Salimicrobium halophilum]SDJ49492.1 DNA-3-methyladenine glycosylase II [Salimicrobium halophilum]
MWRETVTLPFKYDFDFVLERMEEDPLIHLDREKKWVDIPVSDRDVRDVVRVTSIGTTEEPVFLLEGEKEKDYLLERVSDIFLWNRNINEIEDHFKETSLAELQKEFPATPVVKSFHPYDALMRVIIHQQLNTSFAYTLSTRFVQEYGYKWRGVWFYPTPETVASLSYEDLRKLQFSGRKAEYVIDTSRKIVKGEVDLHSFYSMTDEETKNSLTKIRGIGKWTAQNWLMTGLGRPDLFPEADVGIQNAWKKYFDLDTKPDRSEMIPESERWAPYRSYAALLLWRSLMGKK